MNILENIKAAGITVTIDGLELHERQMEHFQLVQAAQDDIEDIGTKVAAIHRDLEGELSSNDRRIVIGELGDVVRRAKSVRDAVKTSLLPIFSHSVIFADYGYERRVTAFLSTLERHIERCTVSRDEQDALYKAEIDAYLNRAK